jgi:CheY-like chemotaxis protein
MMARLFGPRDLLIVVDANTLSARQELRSKLAEVREKGSQSIWLTRNGALEISAEDAGVGTIIDRPLRQSRLREHFFSFLSGSNLATAVTSDTPTGTDTGLETSVDDTAPVLRVLFVEDNKVNQRVAIAMLEAAGITVSLAENGRVALDILSKGCNFDAILMDIHMPEMDGITAATKIRELPAPLSSIPIIALTTNAMKGDREKYLDAGMNDYVSKPVDPIALSDAIERQSGITTTIGARKRRRLPAAPAPTTTESDIETLFAGIDDIVK